MESIVRERCPDINLALNAVGDDQDTSALDLDASFATSATDVDAQVEDDGNMRSTSLQTDQPGIDQALGEPNKSAHEIGMVSLGANQDPRYIGPSSGYFLARVMLPKNSEVPGLSSTQRSETDITGELVEALQGPLPLPPRPAAGKICDAYFEIIHPQYPILHQPTFMRILESVYAGEKEDPLASFQTYMVLAVGASALCLRTKARLPAESYCLSALQFFHLLNIENSLKDCSVYYFCRYLLFTAHLRDSTFGILITNALPPCSTSVFSETLPSTPESHFSSRKCELEYSGW